MNTNSQKSHSKVDPEGSVPEVFQLIDMIGKKLKQIQRQTIREIDLTPPQYFILTILWKNDGRPFHVLADSCQCTRATITGIVDTLEKKGLVIREPNKDDRRSLLVRLTKKGTALKKSTPSLDRIFNGCCGGINLEETKQLSRLLNKLNDSLDI